MLLLSALFFGRLASIHAYRFVGVRLPYPLYIRLQELDRVTTEYNTLTRGDCVVELSCEGTFVGVPIVCDVLAALEFISV